MLCILICSTITTSQILRSLNIFLPFVLVSKAIVFKSFIDDIKTEWQTKIFPPLFVDTNQPYRLVTLSNHKNTNVYPPGGAGSVGGRTSCLLLFMEFHKFFSTKRISEAHLAKVRCRWLLEHGTPNCQHFIIYSSPSLSPHLVAFKSRWKIF